MNFKEIRELVEYLEARIAKRIEEREAFANLANPAELDKEILREASEEVALLDHFIRLLEGIEVTR